MCVCIMCRDVFTIKVSNIHTCMYIHIHTYARMTSMMLTHKLREQTSSYRCVLLGMPTTPAMVSAVTYRKASNCSRPPRKISCLWYAAVSCPSIACTPVTIYLFIYLLVHLFIHLFIHLYIHLFILFILISNFCSRELGCSA